MSAHHVAVGLVRYQRGGNSGLGRCLNPEPISTIEPDFCRIMTGDTAFAARHTPPRLTSIIRCQVGSSSSQAFAQESIPAAATRMSTPPQSEIISATTDRQRTRLHS